MDPETGNGSTRWLQCEEQFQDTINSIRDTNGAKSCGGAKCYGRPLLQTWPFPDLNTIPNNCVRENSLYLSGYGIDFSSRRPGSNPVRILYFCHAFIHLFLCYGICS